MATKIGTNSANTITGTSSADYLDGLGGNDVLKGLDGNDTLLGGDGNDTLYGGNGDDSLDGQAGSDIVYGGYGNDRIYGRDGDDKLYGEYGNDTLYGGAGNDLVKGGDGADVIYGEAGNDKLYGGNGNDTLNGGTGTNYLYGEGGNDTFQFTGGTAYIYAGSGSDTLSFAKAASGVFYEDGGFQLTNAVGFGDIEDGIERIDGSPYADTFLNGPETGADNPFTVPIINGGAGNDWIYNYGGGKIYGSYGNDTLVPGPYTYASGGAGEDTYILDCRDDRDDGFLIDPVIGSFTHGQDLIKLSVSNPNSAFLSHQGDLWTVHSDDHSLNFEVTGVTQMQEGADYIFV